MTAGCLWIFPALLQQGIDLLIYPLVQIFRASFALGYIPTPWRRARVVFIAKPGKDSYAWAKALRPINLSSFLLKTGERLADRWLRERALRRSPLYPNQHAYQAGKSVETALHSLVSRVEKAFMDKESALAAFFDIAGAFDNASFESIEHALRGRGVEQTLINWISAMLHQRSVIAHMGSSHQVVTVHRGCPQGGVLSPLLWTLIMDGLIRGLIRRGFPSQAFADDGVILIVGKHLDVISYLMQAALDFVQRWCQEEGLSVQPEKLELVLFSRSRLFPGLKIPGRYGRPLTLNKG